MKLFFLKEHSLYKIFKTIEKIPDNRTINVYIDPEHAFFDNERRGNQIKELLEKKHINAFFITKTEKAKYFFSHLWLQVEHQEKHKVFKILRMIYDFFFNIKKFHLQMYTQKNYLFYVVFGFEIFFVLLILYLLYSLILPSALITISPSNQVEDVIYNFRYYPVSNTEYPKYSRYMDIPYMSGYIDYKYDMTTSVANITYDQNPSQGEVVLYNQTANALSYLRNTKFVTDDGRMFAATKEFTIPAGTMDNPGTSAVQLKATENDANNVLMWTRWNILKWTKLYIRNVKASYYMQQIYAQAVQDFSGGSLQSNGMVTQKDIDVLSGKLVEYINEQKRNIVINNFKDPQNIIFNFVDLIGVNVGQILIQNKVWEKNSFLKGSIIVRIKFYYFKRADLVALVNSYLQQRSTDKLKSLRIDANSISIFNNLKTETGALVMPTKISVFQSYDFKTDLNGIIADIKSRIVGLTKDKAKEIIISYPEIAGAKITISPPWYTTISKLKSRIKVAVNGEVIK